MTTTQVLGPYESRSVYRDLHSGPTGQKTVAFRKQVWNAQHPKAGDGAAPAALPPAVAAIASQPAPSPFTVDGGAR